MAEQLVSDWRDRISRMRVGWTIRLNNGKLARITWIADTHEASTRQGDRTPQTGEGSNFLSATATATGARGSNPPRFLLCAYSRLSAIPCPKGREIALPLP